MTTIFRAIKSIKDDAEVGVIEDDINKINWVDGNPTNITKEQILAKQVQLQEEYDANKYQRDRAISYPSIKEQLDMMWHDKQNDTTTWEDAIAKIKSDNPKGGS
jgi:hypothetical protein